MAEIPEHAEREGIFWLRLEGGAALRITAAGLLIGRSPGCDVLTRSPEASRRQALVYLGDEGPVLTVLGQGPVLVDGDPVVGRFGAPIGARVQVADLSFEIVFEESDTGSAHQDVWVLETPDGGFFTVTHYPFDVGGGEDDDLRVRGWPPGAIRLLSLASKLEVELAVRAEVDGEDVRPGAVRLLAPGSRVRIGDNAVKVITGGDFSEGTTMTPDRRPPAARSVHLEFLPRGGRLHVDTGTAAGTVYLTDRRCDFVALLLKPSAPLVSGDPVPDEQAWSRVWGRKPSGTRTLHVLLHRVRKDLERGGLPGTALLERSEGGGATRFVLASGADVRIE